MRTDARLDGASPRLRRRGGEFGGAVAALGHPLQHAEKPGGEKRLAEFTRILQKYKAGKASVERRTVAAENWWKLRNSAEERKSHEPDGGFQAVSGWLHNVIVSKHADAMDAFPEPNILPREPDDRPEARILSKILPVILEQNAFEKTYSDGMWQNHRMC